jgi:hypothetical protein
MRAESPIAPSIFLEEPAATVWCGAAGRVKETGDFGGEALPQGGAERDRAVAEGERFFFGRSQVERDAGQVLGKFAGQAIA